MTRADDQVTFSWPATPGSEYRIEFKDDIAQPEWRPLGPAITATSNSVAKAAPALQAEEQRFYRVLWVQ